MPADPTSPGSIPAQRLLYRLRARAVRGVPLTQRQVAALLGIRQQTVNAIERRALAKLRRALSGPS